MKFLFIIIFITFSTLNLHAGSICTTNGESIQNAKKYVKTLTITIEDSSGNEISIDKPSRAQILENLEWNITLFSSGFYSELTDSNYDILLYCDGSYIIELYQAD